MRRFLIVTFLAVACFDQSAQPAVKETRPNFIIMIADDVAWNDLGCYGHPHVRTPNLDQMAKDGMKLTSAFLTCSSCSPSRCSIMTGRYPHSTGARELHQPLPKDQIVFAGLLKKAGYHTAAAGKWHLGNAARVNFDVIVGGRPSGCENWVKVLKERPKDKPFFLWLAGIDAHRPYSKGIIKNPHAAKDVVVPPFLPDVAATRDDLALYYDEITRLDDYAGQVFKELEQQKVAESTLVIFMSDNGRPFPRCKTTIYDSGVKTPFLVRWPKVEKGGVCDSLVSSIDIAPTFCELAGIQLPKTFQGKSFVKLLTEPKAQTRDYVHAEHNWHDYQAHERSIRSKRYLLIENAFPELSGSPPADAVRSPTYKAMQQLYKDGKLNDVQKTCFVTPRAKVELYDVQTDPHCLKNLADDPKHKAARARLQEALAEWREETKDNVPKSPTPDRFDRVTGERLKK